MGYDTSFTNENKQLLKDVKLYDINLVNTSGGGVKVNISWTQIKRSITGCTESYQECDYKVDGSDSAIVKVFVAHECGKPPDKFSTSGCQIGNGELHFGYIFSDDDEETKAIFFVIHPNSWGPYQHRFRTTGMLKFIQGGLGQGASLAASAAAGAIIGSIIPGPGTVIGAGIGGAAGYIASSITPSIAGQYLRYIGK